MLRLLIALLICLVPAVRAEDDKKPAEKKEEKKPAVIAHLKLSGSLEEEAPHSDPLLGTIGENFKAKIDRLKKVAADKSVSAVLLEIDGLAAGWGKVNELTSAIAKVRASGKRVVGYVEGGAMRDYAVALACDEVVLPEPGWLMLTGIRMEITFYKRLLAMVGVQADFVMMGDYKSAAEPFLRDKLSDANREQLTAILDDFYEHEVVGRIAKARKLDAAKVKKLVDGGPYAARDAVAAGLADRVGYLEEIPDELKKTLKVEAVKLEKDYGKKKDLDDLDIFGLYRKLLFGPTKFGSSRADKVAVIYGTGPISTGKGGGNPLLGTGMGSETMVKAIQEAADDKTVKAIVLRIDSPGGSAVASDLIWKALKRSKKPVVASMSDIAGSGGYYIAMGANKIYAEPGTITGSIGVIAGKMATKGLWTRLGMDSEVLARGANSGLFGDEPFTESQRKSLTRMMEDVYDQFLDKAWEGRKAAGQKMTREQLKALAGGRIYTGRQAKANGLIDELGTLEDAIAEAAKLGGMAADKEPEILMLPKAKFSLDALLGGLTMSALAEVSKTPGLRERVHGIGGLLLLEKDPVWAITPYRITVK
jgi:protease-4